MKKKSSVLPTKEEFLRLLEEVNQGNIEKNRAYILELEKQLGIKVVWQGHHLGTMELSPEFDKLGDYISWRWEQEKIWLMGLAEKRKAAADVLSTPPAPRANSYTSRLNRWRTEELNLWSKEQADEHETYE